MAYFSNGSEGTVFEDQCARCKYGEEPCPIAAVQLNYNYEACDNEVAENILNALVEQDGTCTMFDMFKKDFEIDPNQERLF